MATPRRRKTAPIDYRSLTPGEVKRLQDAQYTLGMIIKHPIEPMGSLAVLAKLQEVEDTCRRITRDAFWRDAS